MIAEKPYLYLDTNGIYAVMVPALETNSSGTTWASGPTPGVSIPIGQFYVAHSDSDNAASINAALNSGLNLILTPGVYQLTSSLVVTRPDTVILGLGYPTLVPQTGAPALTISDVGGVKVAGLLFDGARCSPRRCCRWEPGPIPWIIHGTRYFYTTSPCAWAGRPPAQP